VHQENKTELNKQEKELDYLHPPATGKGRERSQPDLKTEAGLRDIDLHSDAARILRNFIGAGSLAFYFRPPKERCLIRETSTGTAWALS
jgi:hypothetical protein